MKISLWSINNAMKFYSAANSLLLIIDDAESALRLLTHKVQLMIAQHRREMGKLREHREKASTSAAAVAAAVS